MGHPISFRYHSCSQDKVVIIKIFYLTARALREISLLFKGCINISNYRGAFGQMISLKVKGKTLEVIQGSHVYFASDEGIGFFQEWDAIEAEELKHTLSKLEKMAEAVMDKLAQAAAPLKKINMTEVVIN